MTNISIIGLALNIVIGVMTGVFFGRWLDRYFMTSPYLLITCLLLSMCATIFLIVSKLHK